jgi:hypothetical protein
MLCIGLGEWARLSDCRRRRPTDGVEPVLLSLGEGVFLGLRYLGAWVARGAFGRKFYLGDVQRFDVIAITGGGCLCETNNVDSPCALSATTREKRQWRVICLVQIGSALGAEPGWRAVSVASAPHVNRSSSVSRTSCVLTACMHLQGAPTGPSSSPARCLVRPSRGTAKTFAVQQ